MTVQMFPQILLILIVTICYGAVSSNSSKCLEDQKMLLLQLRNNLIYDSKVSTKLVDWNETIDCCHWQGITCNGAGQVIGLDLSFESFSGSITPLENLKFLSVVNLDRNNLSAALPDFFADFSNLTALSLSDCNLIGEVSWKIFQVPTLQTIDISLNAMLSGTLPKSMENLKMLSSLDVSICNFTGSIPSSIENLTQLVYLDFYNNAFSGSIPNFSLSKNLTTVRFRRNTLTGEIISSNWDSLESLVMLDLSENSLSGYIHPSLFSLPSLSELDLSSNNFFGQLTELQYATSTLTSLDLSGNNLDGPLPEVFFQLHSLSNLYLSSNNFNGTVQLHKFTKLKELSVLDLSHNSFSVDTNISESDIALLPQFVHLGLASCNLQTISFLKNHTWLQELDLSNNHISGEIPNWIWRAFGGQRGSSVNLSLNQFTHFQEPYSFGSLYSIDLHGNLLTGEVPVPLHTAGYVDFSGNKFDGFFVPDLSNYVSNLWFFSLANNKVSGTIPSSICNATSLQVLDLSSNSLNGIIPACLAEQTSSSLIVLNLGGNNLKGNMPGNFSKECRLETIDLSHNLLEGMIPRSLSNCRYLKVLNAGHNKISDTFPCWLKSLPILHVLVLRFNGFCGSIDCSGVNNYTTWPALQIIDLASNNFSGVLPLNSFLDLKALMVGSLEVYRPNFRPLAEVPAYYHDTVTLSFKGQTVSISKILVIFKTIDFSNNSFVGGIPETVGELEELQLLNLSHNAVTGRIPSAFGNLKQLERLDLSFNKLDGQIPEKLSAITFLAVLNLSYNELVGRIPRGTQFQTFSDDSFTGNRGLCGLTLQKACNINVREQAHLQPDASEDDEQFIISRKEIYVSAAIGFAVGVLVIYLPLLVSKAWKECYNKLLDGLVLWLFSKVYPKKQSTARDIIELYWKKKAVITSKAVPSSRR